MRQTNTMDVSASHPDVLARSSPVRRQLLGAGPSGGTGYTSPQPEDVPLRDWVRHYFGEEGLSLLARNVPLTADRLKGDDADAAVAAKL